MFIVQPMKEAIRPCPPSSSCRPQSNVELQNPAEGRREERKWGQGDLFSPQFTEAEGGGVIVG